jgi:type II secretory pathway pseudopilin PulG
MSELPQFIRKGGFPNRIVPLHSTPSGQAKRPQAIPSENQSLAFTLVELVVTVAVVAILVALLLPAVARSKAKAKETLCTSNLRQIYSGLHLYLPDNGGRFPAGFLWPGPIAQVWNSKEFIGGRDGRDTNAPPGRLRPLFPYLGPSAVFRCPADVGYDEVTKGGFLLKSSQFDIVGLSYFYNAGELRDGAPQSTDGLGGKPLEWVKQPARYALVYEPPAQPHGELDQPDSYCIYWHRARKPGSAHGYPDDERGPRVSPILFVDGHILFINCSGAYSGFPEPVDNRQ